MNDDLAKDAAAFWHEYHRNDGNKPHICDISVDELKKRHANVIKLTEKYDLVDVGTLLAAHYRDVWSSRSCSGHLSEVMGGDDYMDFFCGSSLYYWLMALPDANLHKDFKNAMEADMRGERA